MPFLLDGNPTNSEISEAVNYLMSNFTGNIAANPDTGQIIATNGQIIGYLYKYMMIKYADSFDGSLNFSNTQTNRLYYGLRNTNDSVESTNPADYIWYKVDGGFGTTKTLYYKVTGGRSIEFAVATTSPGYAWVPDTGNVIDLDVLTMAFTVNAIIYQWGTLTAPARPTTDTTYDWLTNSYAAPSGWSTSIPAGGTYGSFLWSITIMVTQTGGLTSSPLNWTDSAYPIVAVGINGQNGNSGLVAYLSQNQASPAPAFSATTTGPNAPSGWSLVAPTVAVGEVLWYIQGQYNSSTIDTVNGVPPNTTAWTGPVAASVFQDIRSDNWNGESPPTPGNPLTYGTQGYYIQRSTGSAYLNNLYARAYIEVGGAASDVNSGITTINGGKITAKSITVDEINNVTTGQIIAGSFNFVSFTSTGTTTWTVPAYVYKVKITVIGGGGGGASLAGNARSGGGGGGGTIGVFSVTPEDVLTINVGAGGAVGNPGTAGGASYVIGTGIAIQANGGAGGPNSNVGTSSAAGGTSFGGDINLSGEYGCISGFGHGPGGSAPFIGISGGISAAASNNSGGGGIGSDGTSLILGKAGGSGLVIIEY